MRFPISTVLTSIGSQMVTQDAEVPHYKEVPYRDAVDKARQEWIAAKSYFNAVTEEGLVDYSIHLMEAAERKYMYLLKMAKDDLSAAKRAGA